MPIVSDIRTLLLPLPGEPVLVPAGAFFQQLGAWPRSHALVLCCLDGGTCVVRVFYGGTGPGVGVHEVRVAVTGDDRRIFLSRDADGVAIDTTASGSGCSVWMEQVQGFHARETDL